MTSSAVWPHVATPPNYPHQCILIGYLTNAALARSNSALLMMVITQKHVGAVLMLILM